VIKGLMCFVYRAMKSPLDYFAAIEDPRVERTKAHLLEDIIFITIAAVICGADTWDDIENYGKAKLPWLRKYLKLPNGIPSHDTINRGFSALDPAQMEEAFLQWIGEVASLTKGEVASIDGKSLRGAKSKDGKRVVHMVSAWASANKLSLGQVKVDEKSNEITAIPKLLEVLALSGCIITIDAMGCQTGIAGKIMEKGADYILAVKGNQGRLEEDVRKVIQTARPASEATETGRGHGRMETRKCSVYYDLELMETAGKWAGLRSVIKLESTRYIEATGAGEKEVRLYISSLKQEAKAMAGYIRAHWGIENSLHWVLDVAFGEDASRKRAGHAAQNYAILNRMALNLMKNDKSKKRSIKGKRLDAGWDNEYLLKILKN
jgi:predicted transposase YbfD/YdcC